MGQILLNWAIEWPKLCLMAMRDRLKVGRKSAKLLTGRLRQTLCLRRLESTASSRLVDYLEVNDFRGSSIGETISPPRRGSTARI